jgi:hypothetical protein
MAPAITGIVRAKKGGNHGFWMNADESMHCLTIQRD